MNKVLLINPFETEQDGFSNLPLGLLYLAGTLLHHGIEVMVVDGCREGKYAVVTALGEFRPDLVGITCLTPGRKRVVEIASLAKHIAGDIPLVLGGAHPTIMYRQMMEQYPQIGYIVRGEGEQTLLELVRGVSLQAIDGIVYRQDGIVVKTRPRKYCDNLDDIPFPAWHLLDLARYPGRGNGKRNGVVLRGAPRISVIFSRGCSGHCDFCSTWWIWKGWRHRSPKNMVDELEMLYRDHGIRHFCFADDAMTVDRQVTVELCDEIMRRNLIIAFHVTTRTDCVDEEMLLKLKQAGCYMVAFGIETGSPRLLQEMDKENDIDTSLRAISLCKKIKLPVTALLIVGNVGETEETVLETRDLLKRAMPDEVGCTGA
jgi:anaerobic magnesium-protoporphyrin IX monomethyl ester cyclase